MRKAVTAVILMACIFVFSESAKGEEVVQLRPTDAYFSLFGGIALPFKTDVTESGVTAKDSKLSSSASIGGKAGIWFTAPRKSLGLDLGYELDITNYNPDQKAGQILTTTTGGFVRTNAFDLNATFIGINFLARLPMGITPELPNGRWFPYLGIGGGVERVGFRIPSSTTTGADSSLALQALGGFKVFLLKHVAVFGEVKFTHSSHSLEFQGTGFTFTDELTLNTVHGVGGVSFHF
jgi:Outer membrane protein beta-barrel domain